MSTGLRVLRPTQRERVTSAQIRTQQQMETYRSAMNKASTTDSKVKLEEKESRWDKGSLLYFETPWNDLALKFTCYFFQMNH